ncbi:hypothetical protein HOG98_03625 [bacterium]|jgi:glutathione S-transferase|nr:hypothetical protein [bacterium]
MKLYTTHRSPYARKVLITAIEKGFMNEISCVEVDLRNKPPELQKANPLGKIPALVTNSGTCYYESSIICDYLDSLSEPRLMPLDPNSQIEVRNLCALSDGITNLAVDHFKETLRPEEKQSRGLLKKFQTTIGYSLTHINDLLPTFGTNITPATISLISALGYVSFRLPELNWRETLPNLSEWETLFSNRESVKETALLI